MAEPLATAIQRCLSTRPPAAECLPGEEGTYPLLRWWDRSWHDVPVFVTGSEPHPVFGRIYRYEVVVSEYGGHPTFADSAWHSGALFRFIDWAEEASKP